METKKVEGEKRWKRKACPSVMAFKLGRKVCIQGPNFYHSGIDVPLMLEAYDEHYRGGAGRKVSETEKDKYIFDNDSDPWTGCELKQLIINFSPSEFCMFTCTRSEMGEMIAMLRKISKEEI